MCGSAIRLLARNFEGSRHSEMKAAAQSFAQGQERQAGLRGRRRQGASGELVRVGAFGCLRMEKKFLLLPDTCCHRVTK